MQCSHWVGRVNIFKHPTFKMWKLPMLRVGMVDYVTGGLLDVFYEITEESRLRVTLQSCD